MRNMIPVSLICIVALSGVARADEAKPQPQRELFQRHDESGVAGKEIVLGMAQIPAGTAIGFHIHAGDEIGFVVKGTLTLKTRGQKDRVLHAGDTFFNVRGAVHSVAAEAGGEGGTVVSTWVVDKGVPLATPVP
jgi:quercetin dioxygenase-like cupin family protein